MTRPFARGLRAGVRALAGGVTATVFGFLLPFLAVAAVAAAGPLGLAPGRRPAPAA